LDLGLSQRQVVLVYSLVSTAFGVLALRLSSRLFKLSLLVVLGVLIVVALAVIAQQSERKG